MKIDKIKHVHVGDAKLVLDQLQRRATGINCGFRAACELLAKKGPVPSISKQWWRKQPGIEKEMQWAAYLMELDYIPQCYDDIFV